MRISIAKARVLFANRPAPAPQEYAGEWIAWSPDRSQIVAHGNRFAQVRADAIAAGCKEPLMQRVMGNSFVGGA
jgi:hypothetical protein